MNSPSPQQLSDLTREQQIHVNQICNDFEAAWDTGQPPALSEFAKRGDCANTQAVLLQYLVELDVECRAVRGYPVSSSVYLDLFPTLAASWLDVQIAEATAPPSIDVDESVSDIGSEELLQRLRASNLIAADEITTLLADVDVSTASAAELGRKLVGARCLTQFQLESIQRRPVDPLILGDYVLLEQIGQGGMGTVYRAMHRRMKRTVALKVLRHDTQHADDLSKRFMREVQVAAKLSHPNIVTAFDAGEQHGLSYLVSEFVNGQDLSEVVREHGPLSLPIAVDVVTQMSRGLAYAHDQRVIHRDIKPSNLLLADDGVAKLLDVGLARITTTEPNEDHESDLTTTGLIMGTVDYMAPEQALNSRLADERSDIYSVGCTLHFLLTGRSPFGRGTSVERLLAHREKPIPDLRDLNDCVPTELQSVLESTLCKNPAGRFSSASELVKALEALTAKGLPDITLTWVDAPTESKSQTDTFTEQTHPAFARTRGTVGDESETEFDVVRPKDDRDNHTAHREQRSKRWIFASVALLCGVAAWRIFLPPSEGDARKSAVAIGKVDDAKTLQIEAANGLPDGVRPKFVELEFALIPPGEIEVGGFKLSSTGPFYLSTTEVTVGVFRQFTESESYQTESERDPQGGYGFVDGTWRRAPEYGWKNLGELETVDDMPAAGISWNDAVAFCRWASIETGRAIRLPTEVEWEYASRGLGLDDWCFGNDIALIEEYAWTQQNSGGVMHPVAKKKPNVWGLYDMHGNESEWCDSEDENSPTATLRGGTYDKTPWDCTHSARNEQRKVQITHGAFRVVLEP